MQRARAPDSKKVCASLGQTAAARQAQADETPVRCPKALQFPTNRSGAALARALGQN